MAANSSSEQPSCTILVSKRELMRPWLIFPYGGMVVVLETRKCYQQWFLPKKRMPIPPALINDYDD